MMIMTVSQAQTSETTNDSYPFHTAVVEGREVCGILFNPNDGRFYEFQNPETHDKYAKYTDPKSGISINHDTILNHAIGTAHGGLIREHVNADEWAEFREMYVNTDEKDISRWCAKWRSLRTDSQM